MNRFLNLVVLAFIVLVIMETEETLYDRNEAWMNMLGVILAVVITIEHGAAFWSCTVRAEFENPVWGRLRWQLKFLPVIDLIVIVTFWASEVLAWVDPDQYAASVNGTDDSDDADVTTGDLLLRLPRLLRLLRLFELFQSHRVQRAFKLLKRVVARKGEDIGAALLIMFISLIFIATVMYIVEGNQHEGFDSFDSIPVSIYWGVITLTTIGYGDIYPRTSFGMAVCCFVGFYAVCIGSIPVGIIGAGYVEELQAEVGLDLGGSVSACLLPLPSLPPSLASPFPLPLCPPRSTQIAEKHQEERRRHQALEAASIAAMNVSVAEISRVCTLDHAHLSKYTGEELAEINRVLSDAHRMVSDFAFEQLSARDGNAGERKGVGAAVGSSSSSSQAKKALEADDALVSACAEG